MTDPLWRHFRDIGFNRDTVYGARLFTDDGLPTSQSGATSVRAPPPALHLAIELFFRGEAVSEQDFRKTCGADVFDALCSIRHCTTSPARRDGVQDQMSVTVNPSCSNGLMLKSASHGAWSAAG